jgi:hypothetical protein
MLVDTPGFDDTDISDNVIISRIQAWLEAYYETGITLNGVVYLHSITSPRLHGTSVRHLQLFRRLVGDSNLGSIVLATIFWDMIEPMLGARREVELGESPVYWGVLVERGSQVMRLEHNRDSAMSILHAITENSKIVLEAKQIEGTKADSLQTPSFETHLNSTGWEEQLNRVAHCSLNAEAPKQDAGP